MRKFDDKFENRMKQNAETLLEGILLRRNWTAVTRDRIAQFLEQVIREETAPGRPSPVGKEMKR